MIISGNVVLMGSNVYSLVVVKIVRYRMLMLLFCSMRLYVV